MDKQYLVTKSNYFIMNSSYDLSLEEQKLILTLASMVQPTDEEFKPYVFKISEFMELLGVDTKTKYTEIPKITKELMKKVFEIHEGNSILQVAWLSSARYEKGSGKVTLKFSPDLKPYMLKLNNMFTQYKLANILNMKSKYSPRIYEILKCNEFKQQGYIELEVEELRKLLKTDGIYTRYNDFKKKVIQQSQKELKKLSDIDFDFDEIKTGKKITSIKFYIRENSHDGRALNKTNKSNKSNKTKNTYDEISATVVPYEDVSDDMGIKKVQDMLKGHRVGPKSAKAIYENAKGDIRQIKKVYEYSKTQKIKSLVGFMKAMVVPGALEESIGMPRQLSFNNFSQRAYDGSDGGMTFDELEKKLLGWDE
ncbi:replication initiation protein [Inconstantimicrobium mannanitabidum]|uniref:Replication protein RepA n=1 Tax=Inconstantimicrobium mannanitabidum TaxID=1604901 RepID=A0ACB5RIU3_9CLOT|nr:replication initiation protein [Clostridium sp. TW13]GKX68992.1 replication protein RepA [Clostridium sp. TW13]